MELIRLDAKVEITVLIDVSGFARGKRSNQSEAAEELGRIVGEETIVYITKAVACSNVAITC